MRRRTRYKFARFFQRVGIFLVLFADLAVVLFLATMVVAGLVGAFYGLILAIR